MSVYEVNSTDPLQQHVDRAENFHEVHEVIRTVIVSGKNWENYRLEIAKRYLEAGVHPSYYYTAFAYVEDLLEVKRPIDSEREVSGQTRIWTRWTSFPDIRESEADAALNEALKYLTRRIG